MAPPLGENDAIEMDCLLYAIHRKYGYDFQNYATASLHRRLKNRLELSGLTSYSEMQYRLLNDPAFFETVLADLSINVTEMFRDPQFFRALRKQVVPELTALPFVRVWIAGCATGEEAYSMAILLREEGLTGRFRIYATDFNPAVLHSAKEGIYSMARIRKYTRNHLLSGGTSSLLDHCTIHCDHVIMNRTIKEPLRFCHHNLVCDGRFGEMDLILCRNVLIYFNPSLQNRVIGTFLKSLPLRGFLCLGAGESITVTCWANHFTKVAPKEKIYQKAETPPHGAPCLSPTGPAGENNGAAPSGEINP